MPYRKTPSANPDKSRKNKLGKLGDFMKALAVTLAVSSCGNNYPNNEYNFRYDSNTDKVEGYYNIRFDHSEGSAGYSEDHYNISLSQVEGGYILKINDEEFAVKSPEEAKGMIRGYISDKEEGYVHEEYLKKADDKTADFMEQYKKYVKDEDRAPEKTVSLKNGKAQEESDN